MTPRREPAPAWTGAARAALVLSMLAVGLSGYLTVTHYTDPAALACPDRGLINCTLVTTSSWSAIAGVPVALIGLIWALAMAALSLPWAWHADSEWPGRARLAGATAGALMVLYLVYVELFRVDAICLWCSAVHLTALCLFGVVLWSRPVATRPVRAVPR